MSHYAIGDIQGCYDEFRELLDAIRFDAAVDTAWLVGDLVNRGPASLAVLRHVRSMGNAARVVLGNHDLHLLTVAAGQRRPHSGDTIGDVLAAPDRDEILAWLRTRPLVFTAGERLMVHAGLLPSWSAQKAQALSKEVEAVLASEDYGAFLQHLYGDRPARWDDGLEGYDRLRAIVNVCTRLRFCRADDSMEFREKRGLAHTPEGYQAWFAHPQRAAADTEIVCGHWSTLGLMLAPRVLMLDSGCVWGGSLTAVRLEDRRLYQVPSRTPVMPGQSE